MFGTMVLDTFGVVSENKIICWSYLGGPKLTLARAPNILKTALS